MATRIGILSRSALMEDTKVSTVSAEFTRRWKNTSVYCSQEDFEEVTKQFLDDLEGMGYSREWRLKVLLSAIKGYTRVLRKVDLGLVARNRPGRDTKQKRRHKKLLRPATWFQVQREEDENSEPENKRKDQHLERKNEPEIGDQRQFNNVMFIPYTKGSVLKKNLQKMEDLAKFRERVKYVEKPGPNLGALLIKKDPWEGDCGRPECLVCKHTLGVCTTQAVVYKFTCLTCQKEGAEAHYFGETSKSMFERIEQHRKQIEKGDNNSPMIEHHEETHREEEKPEFKVEMVRSFKKPLERQVFEGIKIAASKAIPMNRKGEWGQNLPPKFEFEEEKLKPARSKGKTLPQKRKPSSKKGNQKQEEVGELREK